MNKRHFYLTTYSVVRFIFFFKKYVCILCRNNHFSKNNLSDTCVHGKNRLTILLGDAKNSIAMNVQKIYKSY